MIILNELIYAENLLQNGFYLPYHKRFKDIFILAKYYNYLGLSMDEISKKLYEFLNKYDSDFDINTNNYDREIINKIAYSVINKNFTFRINSNIKICKEEYNKILKLQGKQLQRLGLIFCVLGKLYSQNIIRAQYKDLMQLIKITSNNRLDTLIKRLEKQGYIMQYEFGAFEIFFLSNDVCDYEIKDYMCCEKCGILIGISNNKTKYCSECAREIQFNQKKEWDRTKRIR